jgi:hypothetical protein
MTDETRAAIDAATLERKKAKDAYDHAWASIQPLRSAWIEADHTLKRLVKRAKGAGG